MTFEFIFTYFVVLEAELSTAQAGVRGFKFVSVYPVRAWHPQRQERAGVPRTGAANSCEAPGLCWELKRGACESNKCPNHCTGSPSSNFETGSCYAAQDALKCIIQCLSAKA